MQDFNAIKQVVIDSFSAVGVFVDEQSDDVDISEYHLDSITYISFIVELESRLTIEIPEEYLLLNKFVSLNGFVNMLEEVLQTA